MTSDFEEKITAKSGKITSSLEDYWRPPFIGDPHGRLVREPKIVVIDSQILFGDPRILVGDPRIHVGDPRILV